MQRQVQPVHLFDDLSRQFSDVAVPNDSAAVGKYPLAFGPGGMQGCLRLFRWSKSRSAKRMIIGLRRYAKSAGNRESFCEQTRQACGFPPDKRRLRAGGQGKKERAIH